MKCWNSCGQWYPHEVLNVTLMILRKTLIPGREEKGLLGGYITEGIVKFLEYPDTLAPTSNRKLKLRNTSNCR